MDPNQDHGVSGALGTLNTAVFARPGSWLPDACRMVAYASCSCANGGDLGWWGGWRVGGFMVWGICGIIEAELK